MYVLFRRELVTAVWAAVRVLKPLLYAFISEDVFALGQANWLFDDTVRVLDTELVVADHTSYIASEKCSALSHFSSELTSISFLEILGV